MTTKLKTLLLLSLLLLNFTACSANATSSDGQSTVVKYETPLIDAAGGKVLTITKVKTPVYAVRPLVVNGFRNSVPEYKTIKGLLFKIYSMTEKNDYFGGIYLWESEQAAKNWFNAEWFARIEKKYGAAGQADYYQVVSVTDLSKIDKTDGDFWAVLSFVKPESKVKCPTSGLLKAIEVKDANLRTGFVTLWNSQADAVKYFETAESENTFFDTPVLIDNSR